MRSVLQDWVMELGLRQQGVLLTAVRGCDMVPKSHVSKTLTRAFRCEILVAHARDPKKSSTFIEYFEEEALIEVMHEFCRDLDVYPLHYVLHMTHAAEIVGYYHPDISTAAVWQHLYRTICKKLHMTPETKEACARRLDANEEEFKAEQEAAGP